MGQIVGKVSNIFRCNLRAIQSGGTKASTVLEADEVWLIDTTNSLTNSFSGNCDCYIIGDETTAATSLPLHCLADEEPTEGSTNGVQSGGVWKEIKNIIEGSEQNYKEGYQLTHTGAEVVNADAGITDFIPYTQGDSVEWKYGSAATTLYLLFYDSSKNYISGAYWVGNNASGTLPISASSITRYAASAVYLRASFLLAENGCYVKVGGEIAWQRQEAGIGLNTIASKVEQLENELSEVTPLDNTPTSGSQKCVTSGGVFAAYSGQEFLLFNEGKLTAKYIENEYVHQNTGAFVTYTGWARTDYINVGIFSSLEITATTASIYNGFYDKNKNFLSNFPLSVGNNTIAIPNNARYIVLSNTSSALKQSVMAIVDYNGNSDDIKQILEISNHAEPAITFTNTGYYITASGTLDTSSNWSQSNVIHLYKNDIVKIFCSGTSANAVIIALTDTQQSFYTPVTFATNGQTQSAYEYKAVDDCYIIIQYYRITGSVSIYSDSVRLTDIENEIDVLSADIIPDYAAAERERVYRKVLSMTNTNSIVAAFNTDQHFGTDYWGKKNVNNPQWVMNGIRALVNIAKRLPLDCIVLGGDVSGYGGGDASDVDGILNEVNVLCEPFAELDSPVISIPGNHDAYQNNNDVTAQGMYNVHYKRSRYIKGIVHNGTDNCDSYFDDTDNKVRYIFIDTWSRNVRTESYTTFLTSALSSMESDYKAIIFSHNPLTNEFAGVVKYIYQGNEIDAFQNPTDLHSILNNYASQIIACICGHAHVDAYGVSSSNILYIETTAAGLSSLGQFGDIPYIRTMDSATETAYDFFVIDTETQTIEAVRYGQGTNRKWYYKGANIGLIENTNCVYGIASVANASLVFTEQGTANTLNVTCDGKGYYEIYLELGKTYTISCSGYTIDTTQVTINGDVELNLTLT